jgi:hypothetical protein
VENIALVDQHFPVKQLMLLDDIEHSNQSRLYIIAYKLNQLYMHENQSDQKHVQMTNKPFNRKDLFSFFTNKINLHNKLHHVQYVHMFDDQVFHRN